MRWGSRFIRNIVTSYRFYTLFLVVTALMAGVALLHSATSLQRFDDYPKMSGQRVICESKCRYNCFDKESTRRNQTPLMMTQTKCTNISPLVSVDGRAHHTRLCW